MKIARLPDGSPEIFATLQGEGISAGVPAVFVRTSLCNLHCVWCDTDYTWNWTGTPWAHERDGEPGYSKYDKQNAIIEMTSADVAGAITMHAARRLVVTGGEPFLQQEEVLDVIEILRERDPSWEVEIETNGTIRPNLDLDELVLQYNVSPKLANSGNAEELRLVPAALAWFAASPKASFKFVVASPADLAEIEALQARLRLDPARLILMPEGRDAATLHSRRRWVAEACLEHGFRFSDRLHIALWGPARAR